MTESSPMYTLAAEALDRLQVEVDKVRDELGQSGLASAERHHMLAVRCHLAAVRLNGAFSRPMLKLEEEQPGRPLPKSHSWRTKTAGARAQN